MTVQKIPQYDPADPYKMPALMPSSADRSIRSFNPADFPDPSQATDEWRYAPLDQLRDVFEPFTPSGAVTIEAHLDDGTPVPLTRVSSRGNGSQESGPQGNDSRGKDLEDMVGKPVDRSAAIEWQASTSAGRIFECDVTHSLTQPLIIRCTGINQQESTNQPGMKEHRESERTSRDAFHLIIRVAANVHADIVLDHTGYTNCLEGIDLQTGANSDVNFSSIQEWDPRSRHLATQHIRVGENARLQHNIISLSSKIVRIRMDPQFDGPNGFLNMLGIYYVDPGSYMEHRTMVVHNYPQCTSRVVYKGALDGTGARSAWVGNALILPKAPKTDSYELNRNLVLSPGAIANSEPQLEIENGDIVGAGHASSVGRFDDEQLFYLESRGIGREEARKLVVRGFFADLISQIGVHSVEKQLMDTIDRRLARGESSAMTHVLEGE